MLEIDLKNLGRLHTSTFLHYFQILRKWCSEASVYVVFLTVRSPDKSLWLIDSDDKPADSFSFLSFLFPYLLFLLLWVSYGLSSLITLIAFTYCDYKCIVGCVNELN